MNIDSTLMIAVLGFVVQADPQFGGNPYFQQPCYGGGGVYPYQQYQQYPYSYPTQGGGPIIISRTSSVALANSKARSRSRVNDGRFGDFGGGGLPVFNSGGPQGLGPNSLPGATQQLVNTGPGQIPGSNQLNNLQRTGLNAPQLQAPPRPAGIGQFISGMMGIN